MAYASMQVALQRNPLPWLSGALVGVALLIFLLVPTPPDHGKHDSDAALEAAFLYWQTHGYLEPNQQVQAFADRFFDERYRSVAIAAVRELGLRAMPESAAEQRAERARLDVLSLAANSDPTRFNPLDAAHPLRKFGLTPSSPNALGALTHVFLHAGWFHFCSVAILFLLLGAGPELRWGRSVFALFLLGATLFSGVSHWLLEPKSAMTWFGASGPVASLFMVFMLRHRVESVRVVVPMFSQRPPGFIEIPVPAFVIPSLWIFLTAAQTLWLEAIGVRNDYSTTALAGGLVFGAAAALLLRGFGIESRVPGEGVAPDARASALAVLLDEGSVASESGDADRAFEFLTGEADRNPDDLGLLREYWSVATSTGQAEVAAPRLATQIRGLVRKGELDLAAALWCELAEQLPNHRLHAADLVALAPTLLANHDDEFARAALRQAVDAGTAEVGIGVALQIVELARDLDPHTALRAARRALEFDELHATKRARVLSLIQELTPQRVLDGASEAELHVDAEVEARAESDASAQRATASPRSRLSDSAAVMQIESAQGTHSPSASAFDDSVPPSFPDGDEPLPAVNLVERADPELTQAPYLRTPPPDIALDPQVGSPATLDLESVDLASLPRFDAIRIVAAVPTRLTHDALYFRLGNGRRAKVAYREVQAIAVAALRDIASKPVVVIDLLLNWNELSDAPLRSIRLRSDQFDPARLIADRGTPTANLSAFLQEVHARTDALALPDEASVRGTPFRAFKFLRGYQRRVLKVDC